mmetsp:Transcript_9736/g.27477  ORF Transcript_9736/g.27477 Transcript_9736/m.27477 type:complete len:139 (-) Transcript_9736:124-540(-)
MPGIRLPQAADEATLTPPGSAHHWRNAVAAAVGEGVATGVWPVWTIKLPLEAPTGDGDPWTGPAITWVIDATIALCKKPVELHKSGGAVITGCDFMASFMLEGVRPDGTSMKVFFTGNGTPLFVAPNKVAASLFTATL